MEHFWELEVFLCVGVFTCPRDSACLSRGGARETVYAVPSSLRTVTDAYVALVRCTSRGSCMEIHPGDPLM